MNCPEEENAILSTELLHGLDRVLKSLDETRNSPTIVIEMYTSILYKMRIEGEMY